MIITVESVLSILLDAPSLLGKAIEYNIKTQSDKIETDFIDYTPNARRNLQVKTEQFIRIDFLFVLIKPAKNCPKYRYDAKVKNVSKYSFSYYCSAYTNSN